MHTLLERLAGVPRLVVTGGEPLLQRKALSALAAELPPDLPIEIETNGTRSPGPELLERVQQWNVSPKLANSGESLSKRFDQGVLTTLRDTGRAWLKLVVGSDACAQEAGELVRQLEWPRERVLFMPQAATRESLLRLAPVVRGHALAAAVGFSSRLHIEQWDGRRGV